MIYGWQEVPNRSSVQVGANPAVTRPAFHYSCPG